MTSTPALAQFETPLDVADLLLGFALHKAADRVLDPGCGEGVLLGRARAWQEWLAPGPHDLAAESLVGVELDGETAVQAAANVPGAHITHANFFALSPGSFAAFDAVVGNPPYTRGQAIGALETHAPQQMPLFPTAGTTSDPARMPLVSAGLADLLGGHAGLYAYFFLHSTRFLREGGRLAFVVPNAWLDVAYGTALKRFLLEHYRLRAIVESRVERWFDSARINTCLILLEKCGNVQRRRNNLVHLVRLQQPTGDLLPPPANYRRFIESEQLMARLLPGRSLDTAEALVHVLPQKELRAEEKWGIVLRAPVVLRQERERPQLAPLGRWLAVERGYTTGANEFFYLTPAAAAEWGIEARFRRPLLKSLRGLDQLRLGDADSKLEALVVPPHAELRGTAVADYVAWGVAQGFPVRTTCAVRRPWFSLPPQEPAPLVLAKGVWRRHGAPLLLDGLAADQQLYGLYPAGQVSLLAAAALLNSAWFALQVELHGRVSFGRGLLWLAAYELAQIRLPDPRQMPLSGVARLEEAFLPLLARPQGDSLAELAQPDRQALDEVVFDLLGLGSDERAAVLSALRERLDSRRQRALASR